MIHAPDRSVGKKQLNAIAGAFGCKYLAIKMS